MTSAREYLAETVRYGGMLVRRADVERHLDHLGCTGPARLAYGRLPAVDAAPEQRWNDDTKQFRPTGGE